MIERWTDAASGLDAYLCIDDPEARHVAGGIRTWSYASADAAMKDARDLARAMTIKCLLGGVEAAGAKTVVRAGSLRDRAAAFRALGERIEALDGRYLCAGDLGTTPDDLAEVRKATSFVRTDETYLGAHVARSVIVSMEVLAERTGRPIESWRVGIRGCGAIGSAVAHALHRRGASLVLEDLDDARAASLAAKLEAKSLACGRLNAAELDVICPCGSSRDLDAQAVGRLNAWGICGAANNILVDDDAARAVVERELWYVPDVVASSGAVIQGVAEALMGLSDTTQLFDALRTTAAEIVDRSRTLRRAADAIAIDIALERRARRAAQEHTKKDGALRRGRRGVMIEED